MENYDLKVKKISNTYLTSQIMKKILDKGKIEWNKMLFSGGLCQM